MCSKLILSRCEDNVSLGVPLCNNDLKKQKYPLHWIAIVRAIILMSPTEQTNTIWLFTLGRPSTLSWLSFESHFSMTWCLCVSVIVVVIVAASSSSVHKVLSKLKEKEEEVTSWITLRWVTVCVWLAKNLLGFSGWKNSAICGHLIVWQSHTF